jgi:hypothetical protein
MARTRATTYCTIHGDPEWLALTPAAKLVYLTVNSQATVSLAGCLDYNPAKWAKLTGYPTADVEETIEELIEARFLAVDDETFECVVRTFTKWDVGELANKNTIAGMWSAWKSILSPTLRRVVLDSMPPKLRATGDPSTDGTTDQTTDRTADTGPEEEEPETCRSNDVTTTDGTVDRTTDATAVPTTSSSSSSGTATASNNTRASAGTQALAIVPDTSPPSATGATMDDRFEAFWSLYPNKSRSGKLATRKAWDKARKSVDPDLIHASLVEHLGPTSEWATTTDFVPGAARWLNEGRYLSPPPKPRRPSGRDRPADNLAKIEASLARMNAGQR